MKNKTKEAVINKLKGLKKFNLTWYEETEKTLEIEAESEEEAGKLFHKGELDFDSAVEGSVSYVEDSLEIEEYE